MFYEGLDHTKREITPEEQELAAYVKRLLGPCSHWDDLLTRPEELSAIAVKLRDSLSPWQRDVGVLRVDLLEPDNVQICNGSRYEVPSPFFGNLLNTRATFIVHVVREEDLLQDKRALGVDCVNPLFLWEPVFNPSLKLWVVGLGRVIQVQGPVESKWKKIFEKVIDEVVFLKQPVNVTQSLFSWTIDTANVGELYQEESLNLSLFLARHWEEYFKRSYKKGWLDYLTSAGFKVCVRGAPYPFKKNDPKFLSHLREYRRFLSDTAPIGSHHPVESKEFGEWLSEATKDYGKAFWSNVLLELQQRLSSADQSGDAPDLS